MGRTQQSQGLAPPAIRKDQRAKQARQFINKTIPAILASNARARKGADGSELVTDPGPVTFVSENESKEKGKGDGTEEAVYIKRKGQGRRKAKGTSVDEEQLVVKPGHEKDGKASGKGKKRETHLNEAVSQLSLSPKSPTAAARTTRLIRTDTLTAARLIKTTQKSSRKDPNVCILNMASPLRPGGGVLAGATSQEEILCTHTTLLPSLNESFYRLPEYGGIFTRDVLVLRDANGELGVQERYFVDAISAGMLRFPDLLGEEDEEKRLSRRDRLVVESKMRAVLRIASSRGARKIVLGAWGCGAYGNPVRDIAEIWRKVLGSGSNGLGQNGKRGETLEKWEGISDVVFAITNRKIAQDFAEAFDPNLEIEPGPVKQDDGEDEDETDEVAEELRTKIQEMEGQVEKVWNADLKKRMGVILKGLRTQLREREGAGDEQDITHDTGPETGASEDKDDVDVDGEGTEGEEESSGRIEDGGCSISLPKRS
ncbi:hypothetical protein P280DRAFT_7013 [Massarina eburnea CBS 473.64]|uniref:Microbial-type PARG catalytic domain-containing protein n=1 Tax=Massarina eburnea CBS 473.64 TaxID=1395130 RepID=A0A6A6SEU6_9PLEO|nr:hypothetical protein P280DRAFT_7013 [Massarina eburnea CBS 473.64]